MPEKLAANKSIIQKDNDLISLYNNKNKNTIVINTRHLKISQDSHDFVYNSSNWLTPPSQIQIIKTIHNIHALPAS
jgi:hypothetical protein